MTTKTHSCAYPEGNLRIFRYTSIAAKNASGGKKNLEEENDLEDQGADRRILIWFLRKQHGVALTGFNWLSIGTNCGLL